MRQPNGRRLLGFAKSMRHQPTDAEAVLWKRLCGGRLPGFKFKRQQPLGPYILDFVCFEQRLVIEVDGGQHAQEVAADAKRSRWLQGQRFQVLRFSNHDVILRTDDVLEAIMRALRANPSSQPSPTRGEGVERVD